MDFSNLELKELASLIYETLKKNQIDAVLVGGACVSIYSHNQYQSADLDFATYENLKPIETALKKLGFKRNGRCFSHDKCAYMIDFVNPPISVGQESLHHFNHMKTKSGLLVLLTPTDCIKDRLASFFHWNDEQALEQAVLVAKDQEFDLNNLIEWAEKEGFQPKLSRFLEKVK